MSLTRILADRVNSLLDIRSSKYTFLGDIHDRKETEVVLLLRIVMNRDVVGMIVSYALTKRAHKEMLYRMRVDMETRLFVRDKPDLLFRGHAVQWDGIRRNYKMRIDDLKDETFVRLFLPEALTKNKCTYSSTNSLIMGRDLKTHDSNVIISASINYTKFKGIDMLPSLFEVFG